ncbi:hypothetical protein PIB30_080344 [Stylosanthes scabra]|uniref:CCHC-type domain-containing protein n=1 Tax=Stylosanthes scabra TaxID=79078 RepID=A0ABU6UU19_9FABA|nr:hypothetical protein [Stylosanthes scabra]
MNPNKVRKTFEVTCSKCGENGHYYRTCKNNPQDPNWKALTKKERRATKGGAAATASSPQQNSTQVESHVSNDAGNVNNTTRDPVAKARKNKKKIPKPGVRVKPPKEKPQTDEIPISQSAPNAEEQPIIRPQPPPATAPNASNSATGPTLADHNRSLYTNAPTGVSAETMAATSSGTAARLFRYMPTPGFKPPKQK